MELPQFVLSQCLYLNFIGGSVRVGELKRAVNPLPSGWEGSNPSSPTIVGGKMIVLYSKQALEKLVAAISEVDNFEKVERLCGSCNSCSLGSTRTCIHFQMFFEEPYCRLHGAKA